MTRVAQAQKDLAARRKTQAGRTYLKVPFARKDAAKAAGARWDPDRRSWYYAGGSLPSGLQQFKEAIAPEAAPRRTGRRTCLAVQPASTLR
ncbi:MAG: DUF5710 domain-containing protein [Desulfobacterales bacterium]|nr:DUF5710 domain-containing protein [Desulfobacterales bacterium]